ncbi:uncharacterized protein LOC143897547 isoform X2 [Temnothorax americanus]|uniref:uncharacterized protein LOC143897547 isoform X2 n=1 Tax=Temnothorax americanus TaxID=1964332 RepID=UPI004067FB39
MHFALETLLDRIYPRVLQHDATDGERRAASGERTMEFEMRNNVQPRNSPLQFFLLRQTPGIPLLDFAGTTTTTTEFGCEPKDTSGRCVNVGSGTGETTRKVLLPVLNRDAVTIGTDVSESMVEYANRIHGVDGVLEFETLDIFRRETCPRSTSPSSTTRSHSPFCISATTSGLKK